MDFKELGLTPNETKVYETLLRLGKTSAGQLSKESQVPYGRIYTVLASLEEKGLVKVVPEETKKYVATDPEKLHEIITSRIQNLTQMESKINELKKIYDEHDIEPILIAKGKSNFYKIVKEMKETKKYEYNIKYSFEPNPLWIKNTKDKISGGIDTKTIGKFDLESKKSIKQWKKTLKEIKPIENDGVAMSIIDDEEVMIGLIKSNTTMLVRDKAFAKIMRQVFTKYYENTEYANE
jgi:sugar-specific transcriptional regulator TrmB